MVGGRGPQGEPPVELVVARDEDGERLDRVLAARDLGFSRSVLQRWIAEGRVLVDGAPADKKAKVRAGQHLTVRPAPPPPSEAVPQDIPLSILFEDEHVLVVDKPAGLVVHPAPGHPDGTLVNALLHYNMSRARASASLGTALQGGDRSRPGIVHRLDKDTSGVMVVARTDAARESLVAQFQAHSIERRYRAIAVGSPPEEQTHDTLHGRHRTDRKRFTTRVERGRRAVTRVRVLEQLHGAALVECALETGRTHQIRVHLAEAGTPVLGDPLYGGRPRDPRVRGAADDLGRQALHADVLGFEHPHSGQPLSFRTEPPADFLRALERLRG